MAAAPATMRAALCTGNGAVDDVLTVVDDVPRPAFDPSAKATRGFALVRVLATALAPGDIRVLSGQTREIQGPPSFPYIPGGADLCGVVKAVADGEDYLQVGDRVVSQFYQNWGGLAEFALVKSSNCARAPPAGILSAPEAAATASSGCAAVAISRRHVRRGDRVLVVGGSGGVGAFLVQLARARGASFVAAVSTQTALMRELGVDRAVDYREEDVWTLGEFQQAAGSGGGGGEGRGLRDDEGGREWGRGGQKFDVVFDLVEKGWDRVTSKEGRARPIVKSGWQGGRFVTTVPPCGKWFEIHSVRQMLSVFVFPVLGKVLSSLLWPWGRPRYKFALAIGVDSDRSQFTEIFDLIEAGDVKVVLDGGGARGFTTEGVREAFRRQESGHAHGKIVVRIAAED